MATVLSLSMPTTFFLQATVSLGVTILIAILNYIDNIQWQKLCPLPHIPPPLFPLCLLGIFWASLFLKGPSLCTDSYGLSRQSLSSGPAWIRLWTLSLFTHPVLSAVVKWWQQSGCLWRCSKRKRIQQTSPKRNGRQQYSTRMAGLPSKGMGKE